MAAPKIMTLEDRKKLTPFSAEVVATEGIEFLSFEEIDRLNTATRSLNSKQTAEIFAAYISRCPEDWGAASDVKTWQRLPYKTHIQPLIMWFSGEVNGGN